MNFARPDKSCLTLTSRDFICEEVDQYGNPDFQKLLYEFQESALEQVEGLDLGKRLLNEQNLVYVLMREKIALLYPFVKEEKYTIVTYPLKGTRLEMPREAYVLDKQDRVVCLIDSLWILIDIEKRRIAMATIVNDVFNSRKEIQKYERVFEDKLYRLETLDTDNLTPYIYKVKESDIDANGHMNNTMYFRLAQTLGFSFLVKTIEINFEKECFLNDEISVFTIHKEDSVFIEGYHKDHSLSFILELKY